MVSNEAVTPVAVARVLYALINGASPDAAGRNLAAAYFAETGAPVDYRSFQRFTDALILSLPRQSGLLDLVPKWGTVFGRNTLTEVQAEEFIRQYLAALDHSLFVKLPLFVGRFAGHDRHPVHFGGFGDTQVNSWLLVYTLAGRGQLRAGLREYELTGDSIILVEPGTLTNFSGSGTSSWNLYWVIFQCADSWRSYLQWPHAGPGVRHLAANGASATEIRSTLGQLYENFVGDGPLKTELDHNLLEQLLLRCANCLPRGQRKALDARIQAARSYIDEHYADEITLSDVAAASNISASRLSGLFKQETGSSVMSYRNELRLAKAAQLLLQSNLRIAEIGSRVGYPEQAFFSRIFRKYLGLSPRQYRASRPSGDHFTRWSAQILLPDGSRRYAR
jgi:AraC family transcriptional regulator, arabinose operon regulatory protein